MFVLTNTQKEFIPESEKSSENPLTFIVIPPTRQVVLSLQEELFKSLDITDDLSINDLPLAKIMELYLSACVVDWKNVKDEEGNDVPFSQETFKQFNNVEILTELYNFIKELGEGTEKN
jgi:hypothetical protein